MSITEIKKSNKEARKIEKTKKVVNYMGSENYVLNPLLSLKMISASSIFAEPQYYVDGLFKYSFAKEQASNVFAKFNLFTEEISNSKNTANLMEQAIIKALDYDFKETLLWAKELRQDYNMRLNPQVIMVLASKHPKRVVFNKENPGLFREIQKDVLSRADEPGTQMNYYIHKFGSKKNLPNILKKTWAEKLSSLRAYEVNKYRQTGNIIDVTRLSHASSPVLDELLKTGKVKVNEEDASIVQLRSSGKSWLDVLNEEIHIPYMALLKNIRAIWNELGNCEDTDLAKKLSDKVLNQLVSGAQKSKQFPFRFKSAYDALNNDKNLSFRMKDILETLDSALEASLGNLPKLSGKTAVLSDNSGSAHGSFVSSFGTVSISDISNLSAAILAKQSDEAEVGVFGDRIKTRVVKSNLTALDIQESLNEDGEEIGFGTETGLYLFILDIIEKQKHYDNIFIFSDQQAGHARLYHTGITKSEYDMRGNFYDIPAMIEKYRQTVNPKVNVFSVQVGGYSDNVLPEVGYRIALTAGWTGKEIVYADTMIKLWNQMDSTN